MTGTDLRRLGGELESYPLLELLPLLAEKRASGVLTLRRGTQRRWFVLHQGAVVRAASADPREYFGQLLVDYGMVSSQAAAEAFLDQETTRVMVGELLPRSGALDEARVRAALLLKARESLLDCYRWEHGEFDFEPGEPPADAGGLQIAVELAELHREALGRTREWREFARLFPEPETALRAVEGADLSAVGPDEQVLLELAGDGLTVAEALGAFRDGDYQVYRRLAGLVGKGLLEVAPVEGPREQRRPGARERLERAGQLLQGGSPAEAETLASQAAEQGPSRPALRVLREAQTELALRLADELLSKEGAPFVKPGPRELDALDLQPAERYLLSRVASSGSLREAVRGAPMGELEALRILQRLVAAGVLAFREEPADPADPAAGAAARAG